jgi:hypothetical protein
MPLVLTLIFYVVDELAKYSNISTSPVRKTMNPVLQQVDDWLKSSHDIETDHGGDDHKYIGFELNRNNQYSNIIFSIENDSILAWYGDPKISGEDIAGSAHGNLLDHYLLRTNERLGIGRWARSFNGDLLFDVSVPINGTAPPSQLMSNIYDIACDAFDMMISRIRLLLEYGFTIEDPRTTVYAECLAFAAETPSLLPRLESLGFMNRQTVNVLEKMMITNPSPWSASLQQQTRDAIDEMRVAPDGALHLKHKALGYGSISMESLASESLVLRSKKTDTDIRFDDVQTLLDAGWAID